MIAVYSGDETIYVDEIEWVIKKLKIPYKKVYFDDIINDKIKGFSLLIIPGSFTEKIASKLSGRGYENIKKFVKSGGGYIGICAGAYLASKKVEVPDEKYMKGLGIINARCRRESKKRKSDRKRVVKIIKKHVITQNFFGKINVWYLNGPLIKSGKNITVLGEYNNKQGALVFSRYGKGRVILFSFHPEKRKETVDLLKNAILFGLK